MDASLSYYYCYDPNSIYCYPTQVPSIETYQNANDGQLDAYSYNASSNLNNNQIGEDEAFRDPDTIPLPKDLTDLFKPLECELCGVQVTSETSAFTHYEGKVHIKNVNAYMREHYNVEGSLQLKKERFIPVKCDVCNIELTSKVVYQQHFSGKQHQKNLRKIQYKLPTAMVEDIFTDGATASIKDLPPPPLPPVLSDFVCEICNITTNTEHQLNLHKSGQKHKKKLKKHQESKLDRALNAFYSGEWPEATEPEVYTAPAAPFVENPEMDYPLQFNDFQKTFPAGSVEAGIGSNDSLTASTVAPAESDALPSSLEPKTIELPVELGIKDGKVLSSTAIFLQQLSVISQTTNNKEDITNSGQNLNNSESASTGEKESAELYIKTAVECSSIHSNELNANQMSNNTTNQSDVVKNSENSINDTVSKVNPSQYLEKESKCVDETATASGPDNNKDKKDSQLDQEITKLAIEEIEKESTNFQKTRASNKLSISEDVTVAREDQLNKNKCTFDKAGYRINMDIVKSKESSTNKKENYCESDKKRNMKNSTNYNNRWHDNRNYSNYGYNGYWYNNWRNADNYSKYYKNQYGKYFYRGHFNERNEKYETKSNRNHEKRKRDNRHISDEERSHSYKSRRKRYKDDKYKDKKHRSRSRSRERCHGRRSRKHRSSSSSYSDRSQSDRSGREQSKKNKSIKKNEEKRTDERTNNVKSGEYRRDRKRRSRSESTSRSSSGCSRKSSDCHDYRLDKDGWCEKQHRCQNAYKKCPYKHKEPFKIKTEKVKSTEVELKQETSKNSWNQEAPKTELNTEVMSVTQIKVEQDDKVSGKKVTVDPALSVYITSTGSYYCKYCVVSTRSNELFREHLQTPKHALLTKFKKKIK